VTHDQIEAMTMASRIAVMDRGEIQQFAAPEVVYGKPANLFVARFLGTPPMNTIAARLAVDGEGLTAVIGAAGGRGQAAAACAARRRPRPGSNRDVFLGIRPECISMSGRRTDFPTARFEAEVVMSEPTGAETVVLASAAGERLRAPCGARRALRRPASRAPFLADTRNRLPVRSEDRAGLIA
jgi:multiple sugar transport system ATP-binding protein